MEKKFTIWCWVAGRHAFGSAPVWNRYFTFIDIGHLFGPYVLAVPFVVAVPFVGYDATENMISLYFKNNMN